VSTLAPVVETEDKSEATNGLEAAPEPPTQATNLP
jgi:hypothetical protein